MNKKVLISIRFIILSLFVIFTNCNTPKKNPTAFKGEIDLRDWSFKKDGVIKLNIVLKRLLAKYGEI